MSAETLGKKLLDEVVEEPFDNVLQSLRRLRDGSRAFTNIGSIDDLLRVFQYGGQHKHDLEAPDILEAPTPKFPIIEITSSGPGQGKTQLLYFLTTIAILPPAYTASQIRLGGHNGAVVIIDSDGRYNVSRLAQVMQFYISVYRASQTGSAGRQNRYTAQEIMADGEDSELVRMCLKHVHVFNPQSFESLLDTLGSLDEYLSNFDEHVSTSRPLSAILLDSASTFYWQERRKIEDAKVPINPQTDDSSSTRTEIKDPPQNSYALLKQSLSGLAKKFSCLVVTTSVSNSRHAVHRSREVTIPSELPAPWSTFPTLRLHVRRAAVDKFPPMHSIQDALRDQPARQEVVSQYRYEILLNRWNADTWGEELRSAVDSAITVIPMWIGDEGMWVKNSEMSDDDWPPWRDLLKANET
ncbi:MAG: hypothetical protein M1822_000411 [Bathelium mastoideum]|nr:MAG: hypothetical protein M1822_000411 [Bathelium mastoideum]